MSGSQKGVAGRIAGARAVGDRRARRPGFRRGASAARGARSSSRHVGCSPLSMGLANNRAGSIRDEGGLTMGLITALFGWFFLQSYVRIPDGYAIDVERDPPRFAAPCDRDNVVSLDVPGGRLLGGSEL